jgi:phospholipase/carboxylesterase
MVPCIYGQAAYETLKKAGYEVTWKTYHMTHSVCDQEIRDLAGWLKKILNSA